MRIRSDWVTTFACHDASCRPPTAGGSGGSRPGSAVARSHGSYGQATAPGTLSTQYARMKAREQAQQRDAIRARAGLSDSVSDVVSTAGHMHVLDDHEKAHYGAKMNERYNSLTTEDVSRLPIVTDKNGSRLTTGQGTVSGSRVRDMPDDPAKRHAGDEKDALPVVIRVGNKRIVRDGHHRLMKRLLAGEPVKYRYLA